MLSMLNGLVFRRLKDPVAAGTSTVNSDSIDTANGAIQTVVFGVAIGAITSGGSCKITAQGSDDNSTFVDLEAQDGTDLNFTVLDGDDSKIALMELVRPQYRYVRVKVERLTANVVLDLIFGICGPWLRNTPVTHPTAEVSHYGNLSGAGGQLAS